MDSKWKHINFLYFFFGCMRFAAEAGTGLYMGPYFPSPLSQNITVHQDTVAYLPCTVKQLGDKSVSWVRQRDADILTVDRYTFVRDDRLTVHYTADTETWTLVIKYVQERDAGSYECQVSTEPKMSMLVHLNVIVPQVEVLGDVDKYVRKGSTARLECTVSSTVQLPDYIFWYHSGERLLEYDHPRVKISVSRRGGQGSEMSITSTLVITNARPKDDGNYTCLPSNLHSASTILHVLNDEHPAAMQTGAAMLTDPPSSWGVVLVVLIAFVFVHGHQNFTLSTHTPPSCVSLQLHKSSSENEHTLTSDNVSKDLREKQDLVLRSERSKHLSMDMILAFLDRRPSHHAQVKDLLVQPFRDNCLRVRRTSPLVRDSYPSHGSSTLSSASKELCIKKEEKLLIKECPFEEPSFFDAPRMNPCKNSSQSLQIILVVIACSCAHLLAYEYPCMTPSRISEYP